MIINHRSNKIRLYGWLVLCIVSLYSCHKDSEGKPSITRLRAISPAPNDSTLTVAGPGQTLVIQGANLATAKEIYFNGYPALFNSALFSDINLVVAIPADMPFANLDQTKLNTVRVVTAFGEVTYNFPIVPPSPSIASMTHENAAGGTRVTINGFNFFYIDKVIFPGNKEVTTGIVTNATGTTLEVTVPTGLTAGGKITVVNRYGTGSSNFLFNDFTTGVLCNFDNVNTFSWGSTVETDASLFPGATGKYAHLQQSPVGANAWDWYNGKRGVITNHADWVPTANLNDPIGNYVMKFDIYVKKPFSAGCLYIGPMPDDNWEYMYRYEPWKTTANYTTTGWTTVTIPLNQFKAKDNNGTNGAGAPVANLQALIGGLDEVVKMMFVNDGSNSLPDLDIAIDNIKVIKLQ